MDFLPLGDVRTDPIINPTCLSDHVHTFYGASVIRPETTYEKLRLAYGNSGNVVENKSLYWHPTVYSFDPDSGVYTIDEIHFSSAYYIWETGAATAFPDGFKMIAGRGGNKEARAQAECVNPSKCKRPNCITDSTFFPKKACGELEVSMAFPTCWDGVNIDSEDHQSHVSYGPDWGEFGGECPVSHPVKIPEIKLFFRIVNYSGGSHMFADGTDYFHADYFNGWERKTLQRVLDECKNYSEASNPDAWCEKHLTFRDAPKKVGDERIIEKLKKLQPNPPIDTTTITDELIDGVTVLPRGACDGTLSPTITPNKIPTTSPIISPTRSPIKTPSDTHCTLPGSNCYNKQKGVGCDDEICEKLVCEARAKCCAPSGSWNNKCKNKAKTLCLHCECDHTKTALFLKKLKVIQGEKVPVLKSCGWLSKRQKKEKAKLCRKSNSFEDYDPARLVCPKSCDLPICPSSEIDLFENL